MTGNFWQDCPVYILLGAVVLFFGYVIVKSNMDDKKNKQEQNKPSGTK